MTSESEIETLIELSAVNRPSFAEFDWLNGPCQLLQARAVLFAFEPDRAIAGCLGKSFALMTEGRYFFFAVT